MSLAVLRTGFASYQEAVLHEKKGFIVRFTALRPSWKPYLPLMEAQRKEEEEEKNPEMEQEAAGDRVLQKKTPNFYAVGSGRNPHVS